MAVWVVPNVEHFGIDDFGHIDRPIPAPDVRNYARRDYGNRVGIWRLMEVLSKRDVPATVALNSDVAIHYPQIVEAAVDLGWELMGHGRTNSQYLVGLKRDQELQLVRDVRKAIEGFGQSMKGWLGPALHETWNTLEILREESVEYVADWIHDDQPVQFRNGLFSIPYSLEINDIVLFSGSGTPAEEYFLRARDAFDTLYEEGRTSARVLCLSLHPYLMGTPHRIKYLDKTLEYAGGHEEVWFARGHEIIDAYRTLLAST